MHRHCLIHLRISLIVDTEQKGSSAPQLEAEVVTRRYGIYYHTLLRITAAESLDYLEVISAPSAVTSDVDQQEARQAF
jgi:hypothetical protein